MFAPVVNKAQLVVFDNPFRTALAVFFIGILYNEFVSKSISEFFVLSACQNYKDFIEIMYSILDKIDKEKDYYIDKDDDKKEKTLNSNYKLIDDGIGYCYHSYARGFKSYY